jgi:hypothetical protein
MPLNRALLFASLLSLVSLPAAQANVTRPTIEVGGGLESAPAGDSLDVLLRLNLDGVGVHANGMHFVIAHIRGDLGVSPTDAAQRIPYMKIDFEPVALAMGDGFNGSTIGVLPVEVGINVRLDESLMVRVDLVRYEKDYIGPSHLSDRALLYAKLAADALGYKMANHVSGIGGFHGGNVATLQAEIGMMLAAGHHIKARIALGGNADLNLGGNAGGGFAVESDMQAYAEVSLDVTRFLRFFVRNGVGAVVNSGDGIPNCAEYQLLAGAMFIY